MLKSRNPYRVSPSVFVATDFPNQISFINAVSQCAHVKEVSKPPSSLGSQGMLPWPGELRDGTLAWRVERCYPGLGS